jgi:hypothetical protein
MQFDPDLTLDKLTAARNAVGNAVTQPARSAG